MEAFYLVVNLLEKVSVLVAVALGLVLLRPAEVWLGETGAKASVRRRLFLVLIFAGLAIWGTFLGFEVEGVQFTTRMIGIIVAGYLGGAWVGLGVGAAAGILYAYEIGAELAPYVLVGSIFSGVVAGLWSRKWGTAMVSVAVGAFAIQILDQVGIGLVMALFDWSTAVDHGSRLMLHGATVTANAVGIILFMGLLSLVRELDSARRDATQSRAVARSARLEALQYQLNPHFLFNLLNTLAYLIRTQPARARELTLDLADFLRYTLDGQGDETALRDELEQIEHYVDLERARFGDGLRFSIEMPEDDTIVECPVPPLILQPLVENAIRHGSEDGEVDVRIDIEREDDVLVIEVLDDGPGPPPERPPQTGPADARRQSLGLNNVRERLDRFYRSEATLELVERTDGPGACARVRIPLGGDEVSGLAEQARRQLRRVVK